MKIEPTNHLCLTKEDLSNGSYVILNINSIPRISKIINSKDNTRTIVFESQKTLNTPLFRTYTLRQLKATYVLGLEPEDFGFTLNDLERLDRFEANNQSRDVFLAEKLARDTMTQKSRKAAAEADARAAEAAAAVVVVEQATSEPAAAVEYLKPATEMAAVYQQQLDSLLADRAIIDKKVEALQAVIALEMS